MSRKLESEMFKEQQYLFEIMHKCHLVCLMGRFAVINKFVDLLIIDIES